MNEQLITRLSMKCKNYDKTFPKKTVNVIWGSHMLQFEITYKNVVAVDIRVQRG